MHHQVSFFDSCQKYVSFQYNRSLNALASLTGGGGVIGGRDGESVGEALGCRVGDGDGRLLGLNVMVGN